MELDGRNLLQRLNGLSSQQDENFFTEVLAYLLRELVKSEPEIAEWIFGKFTDQKFILNVENVGSDVTVMTQVRTENVIPDIVIQSETFKYRIVIEVKVRSEVDTAQLRTYKKGLHKYKKMGYKTCLVILTNGWDDNRDDADVLVRWYEIADWLCEKKEVIKGQSILFVIDQFLEFLKWRKMTMEKVTCELAPGIESFLNLKAMLDSVLESTGIKKSGQAHCFGYLGFYLWKQSSAGCFIGIYTDRPNYLIFDTETNKKDPKEREQYLDLKDGFGETGQWEKKLNFPESGFYELSKEEQIQSLKKFLEGCHDAVKRLFPDLLQ